MPLTAVEMKTIAPSAVTTQSAGQLIGAARDGGEAEHDLRERVELAGDGRIAVHRPEQHPVRDRAEDDHQVAQQHQRRQGPGHVAVDAEADEHRREQQLVCQRVQMLAEFAGPAEALRQRTIERVGEGSDREQRHHLRVAPLQDPVRDRVHQQDAQDAEQVGQEAQVHGCHRKSGAIGAAGSARGAATSRESSAKMRRSSSQVATD